MMQRILVIDDDPAVTSLLKRGLSYEGFAVDTAKSGAEGLTIARERPSDLVILDVMMPGLGGFEVLLARVHALLRRQRLEHPQVLRFADLTMDTSGHKVYRDQREEALAKVTREANRLSRLVADLLALARADAGVPLKHRLLDNALKYTPANGHVTLGLQREASGSKITVRDTGVGIPPEDLPHVFERFYRADPARGRDPGGTGLGLPIARWIVEQHGGKITLESQSGQGTTATVYLPLPGGSSLTPLSTPQQTLS